MNAAVVSSTVMFAMTKGISLERIVSATGLDPKQLADPDARLPQDIVPGGWLLLAARYPGESITLEMARSTPISFFGTVAHAARDAEDVRSASRTFVRYRTVLSDKLELSLHEAGGESHALGFRFFRDVLDVGADEWLRIEFSHPPIGPVGDYEDFFGVPVAFRRPHNIISAATTTLDRPVRARDSAISRLIQGQLDIAQARLDGGGTLAGIRSAIRDLRALQRAARAEGTTVSALIDEARQAHAIQLLANTRLSVEEVAFLLGYSEGRALRRACSRWTGKTPAELRRP